MAGISLTGVSTGVATTQVSTAFQVAALKKQQDVTKELGQMAVQLIQSARIADPAVGKTLDVTA